MRPPSGHRERGERLFRGLLRLYPGPFRLRYANAMIEFYRDRRRAQRAGGGSLIRFWSRTAWDVLLNAAGEQLDRFAGRRAQRDHHSMQPADAGKDLRMDRFAHDLRVALRGLRRTPSFTATVLITLALGIGANAGIFSVVNGILLRPLPFREADQVVDFRHTDPYSTVSEPEMMDYRRDMTSVAVLAAYQETEANLTGGDAPERVAGARISDQFFKALGVTPILGRAFDAAEEAPATGPSPVVIISHGLWQRYYGGDSGIVGRTIQLNGVARTVVGVMPPRLEFPSRATAIWLPLRLNSDSLWTRNNHYLKMVGRLQPGVSIEKARAEATTLARRWTSDYPETYFPGKPLVPDIRPIEDRIAGSSRPYLLALVGAAAFVLLIACVNVANLLLVRSEARRHEMAIRTALGASTGRLTKQLLLESSLLAAGGGLLGLAIAWAGTSGLLAAAPDSIPRLDEIRIDGRVFAFTLAISTATGLLFGLWPAIRAARSDSMATLRQGARKSAGVPARRARASLVITEVALAVVMLAGAGLLIRSLRSLQAIDPGFDPSSMLTARINLPPGYTDERAIAFVDQLEERITAFPGVRGSAIMGWTPVVGGGGNWSIWIDGRPVKAISEAPAANPQQVSADYFQVMGIAIVTGRPFRPEDRQDAPLVTIVNEQAARELWPNTDPLGHTLKMFGSEGPWVTVVGVARDIKSRGVEDEVPPTMYFPYPQAARSAHFIPRDITLAVKTSGEPTSLVPAVREAVRALDPAAPVSDFQTMETVMGASFAGRRFSTGLLGVFAAVALILAGIGIYGVVAYAVSQRTFEIGLRMALGAEQWGVLKLVVISEGFRLIAIGLVIGLLGAVAVGRAIQSLLVGVAPADPVTIGLVVATLTGVGLLASALPARRATRVSPIQALRSD